VTSLPAASRALIAIKVVHTVVWAFFAGCILAIPMMALRDDYRTVVILAALVCLEGTVLALNRGRCPLTDVAGRYTEDRRDNFDIYLPLWLARYNKVIFTGLFVAALSYALAQWRGWL
jgi:hypothetical protein